MDGSGELRTVLRTCWQVGVDGCTPVSRLNSDTYVIDSDAARYLAVLVPVGRRRQFEAGLAVAERLAGTGLPSETPVRAANGALCVPLDGTVVALLRCVDGRALTPAERRTWGVALGTVQRALVGYSHPDLGRFHWVRPDAAHLGVADWVRPVVAAAVEAVAKISVTDVLSHGVLHGDPVAAAFRVDGGSGRTGLVDWGAAGSGPLVYDLACAVMHAGGPEHAADLIEGYVTSAPVPPDEVEAVLPTMLRFRHAVEADSAARGVWAAHQAGSVAPDTARLDRARELCESGA
ncbi:hypothetical protein Val02_67180 [Virgisporangium aliadipatigenens]|uniref:Hydroxylysine kinase n=1 Tax=Virgisporangium aliadipatigenens TaxID=741659 RepID=A0A8J3YSI0_9ACTN|nr:phosphotransferase [Virgisporangium aliadipatigenens]GIJ49832.1 hypothetical protein Val02_67180 [Virgisporangium aliadipatigenens]